MKGQLVPKDLQLASLTFHCRTKMLKIKINRAHKEKNTLDFNILSQFITKAAVSNMERERRLVISHDFNQTVSLATHGNLPN